MESSGDQPERQRWRWPQFTIRGLLVVTAILAAFWGLLLAIGVKRDELPPFIAASFVVLWGLLCLRTVRLNRPSPKHWTLDDTGRPQVPPSRFRDAWFVVVPVLVLAFHAHLLIYMATQGADVYSPAIPAGYPGHVSWAEFWCIFAEFLTIAILWYSMGIWVCVMIPRHPLIRFKLAWRLLALVLSPLVCPFLYFTRLHPKKVADVQQSHRLASQNQTEADGEA
jgi:hypothetical protein